MSGNYEEMMKSIRTASEFNIQSVLHELAIQFSGGNKKLFENVLLVGMQHMLDTTADMLSVMKTYFRTQKEDR